MEAGFKQQTNKIRVMSYSCSTAIWGLEFRREGMACMSTPTCDGSNPTFMAYQSEF